MRYLLLFTRSLLVAMLACATLANAQPPGAQRPLAQPAVPVQDPQGSVLLDVTYAGERLVAVGERGLVLLSNDDGKTWRQAEVPVSVTLTRVRFANAASGWAIGHYGVVLHSADGGETWQRQLDGEAAAQLALTAAQERAQAAPDDSRSAHWLSEAKRLVADGPDKPFLDLYFFDDEQGFIVGAFNLFFATADGGKTWQPLLDRLDNPEGSHLYAIAGSGDTLFIAGERGALFRSDDRGASFARLEAPYAGSFFAVSLARPGEVLLAGLRGNVFRSRDRGATWARVAGAPPVGISAISATADRTLLLANQAGELFTSRGAALERLPTRPLPPFTALVPLSDGSLLGVGIRGVTPVVLSKKIGG